MTAYRYWRIRSPNTAIAGEYMAATEIELRTAPAGADVTGSGTATASATFGAPYLPSAAFDNSGATFWTTGGAAPPTGGHWIQYDFGAGNEKAIQEVSYTSRPDAFREDPLDLYVEFSSDGFFWYEKWSVLGMAAWSASETRVWTDPWIGLSAADAKATATHVRTIYAFTSGQGQASDLHARTIYEYQAQEAHANALRGRSLWGGSGGLYGKASQITSRILIKYGLDSRKLRAWTFTQDDHDFWVLQLGGELTLIYDKLTQQWAQWRSPGFAYWRGNDGVQWEGWNVTCDTESGVVWEIDADGRLDEGTTPIVSIMYGGFTKRFRAEDPCYMAELALSEGQPPPDVEAGDVGISLRTSDDGGLTYLSHGEIPSEAIGDDITVRWYGLGLMNHPNKIFEITDTGYARRIDGLDVEIRGG